MSFTRARSKDQKESRIREITEVAIAQYHLNGYDKVSISTIAKDISFVRSNIYKYFSTREEIFLHIIQNSFNELSKSLKETFSYRKKLTTSAIAQLWCSCYTSNLLFLELMPLLSSIIENNVPLDRLVEFKLDFFKTYYDINQTVSAVFPSFSESDIEFFIHKQYLYGTSLFQMSNQTVCQQDVMDILRTEHGIDYTPPVFEDDFTEFIEFLISGILTRNNRTDIPTG